MMDAKGVLEWLDAQGISYSLMEHVPVYTCEQAEQVYGDKKSLSSKNLLLKDRKSRRFYLFVLPTSREVSIDELGGFVGEKLKFANPDDLQGLLGVTPGSVSPFGLLNDADARVTLWLSSEVASADLVSFHPNDNTKTIELTREDFQEVLKRLSNPILRESSHNSENL